MPAETFRHVYTRLLAAYGPQGWWPVGRLTGMHASDSGGREYHPGDYSRAASRDERFEIITGAILTQNTSWRNVRRALDALRRGGVDTPERLESTPHDVLASLVRSSGTYNLKAERLRELNRTLLDGGHFDGAGAPGRAGLLAVRGVGPETADSILLYAYGRPAFVIDAYTRRLFARLGLIPREAGYEQARAAFMRALPPEPALYNEYHALIVAHGKEWCTTRPLCAGCPIQALCPSGGRTAEDGLAGTEGSEG